MAKNTKKFMKQRLQNVHSKKKQNFQVSQQHQSKTKAQQSLMTMLKKLGQLDTIIKLSLSASALTEEAVEDNLYDTLSARYTKALARAMAYTKQVKAAAVLNNGFNTSGSYNGGDGVSLFNTAHPLVSGGTNSNTQSTPTDLNETALENAVIQIAAWTDERGLLIAAQPRKLVVPPGNQFVATRLLETELRVSTADNDINAIKNNGSIPEGYTINHFLTDPDAYFLTTDVPNGMKHFVRTPLSTSMDGDFDTGNVRYKARERYSFGWSDPLGMWGSPGAA
jgi:phage major head subunit gpT-like protein